MSSASGLIDYWQLSIDAAKLALRGDVIDNPVLMRQMHPEFRDALARYGDSFIAKPPQATRKVGSQRASSVRRVGRGSGLSPENARRLYGSPAVGTERSIQIDMATHMNGEVEVSTELGLADIVQWKSKIVVEVKAMQDWKAAVGQLMVYTQDISMKDFKKCACFFNVCYGADQADRIERVLKDLGIWMVQAEWNRKFGKYQFHANPEVIKELFSPNP